MTDTIAQKAAEECEIMASNNVSAGTFLPIIQRAIDQATRGKDKMPELHDDVVIALWENIACAKSSYERAWTQLNFERTVGQKKADEEYVKSLDCDVAKARERYAESVRALLSSIGKGVEG